MTTNIHTTLCLALALIALTTMPTAADDDLIIRDRDGRRVETIERGIGDRLIRRDPDGRRIGTVEEWLNGRMQIRDEHGRRVRVIEKRYPRPMTPARSRRSRPVRPGSPRTADLIHGGVLPCRHLTSAADAASVGSSLTRDCPAGASFPDLTA